MLYYDFDTHIINLASRVIFDYVINDLPMADTPLNVQHIQVVHNRQPHPEQQKFPPASQF